MLSVNYLAKALATIKTTGFSINLWSFVSEASDEPVAFRTRPRTIF